MCSSLPLPLPQVCRCSFVHHNKPSPLPLTLCVQSRRVQPCLALCPGPSLPLCRHSVAAAPLPLAPLRLSRSQPCTPRCPRPPPPLPLPRLSLSAGAAMGTERASTPAEHSHSLGAASCIPPALTPPLCRCSFVQLSVPLCPPAPAESRFMLRVANSQPPSLPVQRECAAPCPSASLSVGAALCGSLPFPLPCSSCRCSVVQLTAPSPPPLLQVRAGEGQRAAQKAVFAVREGEGQRARQGQPCKAATPPSLHTAVCAACCPSPALTLQKGRGTRGSEPHKTVPAEELGEGHRAAQVHMREGQGTG